MGVNSSLYNEYANLVMMGGYDYSYRADGTLMIKRNKANLDPSVYQMQLYKQMLDMQTYQEALQEAKDKYEEQQDADADWDPDYDDEDDDYSQDDLLRDMDYVKGHIDEAFQIVYTHMLAGEVNDADMEFMDAMEHSRHDIGYRYLAYLIRRVIEQA
jgi:hypothetical protein